MINFSFIIPHKNAPKLLERCIHSIPDRSDIEIIIIDDNSSNIEELYNSDILKNRNVRFMPLTESKGAGYARNEGIKVARGNWLLFADADDYYTNNIDDILNKYACDQETELVYLNAHIIDDNEKTSSLPISKYIMNFKKNRPYSEMILRYNAWTPWTRMVKRNVVLKNNIWYEEVPVGNDKIFCLKCSMYSKKIKAEPLIAYNYYMPIKGSLTYTYCIKPENLIGKLELQLRTNKLYKEVGYKFKSSLIHFYLSSASYERNYKTIQIYKDFFHRNSVSYINDFYYFIKQITGKILGLL